ncbi:Uncharacterised protein [Chlamydia trachomatis]|nr:Uncharacterised protein [Chlamydia trachomatis]
MAHINKIQLFHHFSGYSVTGKWESGTSGGFIGV